MFNHGQHILVSTEIEIELTNDPAILLEEVKKPIPHAPSSSIHFSQDTEIIHVSVGGWMDGEIAFCTFSGTLLSVERRSCFLCNMDRPGGYNAKWSQTDRRKVEWCHLTSGVLKTSLSAEIENSCGYQGDSHWSLHINAIKGGKPWSKINMMKCWFLNKINKSAKKNRAWWHHYQGWAGVLLQTCCFWGDNKEKKKEKNHHKFLCLSIQQLKETEHSWQVTLARVMVRKYQNYTMIVRS